MDLFSCIYHLNLVSNRMCLVVWFTLHRITASLALFIRLIIHTFQLIFSVGIVFFSHNKSANSVFQLAYQHSLARLPLEEQCHKLCSLIDIRRPENTARISHSWELFCMPEQLMNVSCLSGMKLYWFRNDKNKQWQSGISFRMFEPNSVTVSPPLAI
jgi:hypothetical protein